MAKAKPEIVICLGLALVTVALFWPVHNHGFINYDDSTFITQNPHVRTGLTLENIKWAFSDRPTGFWRPLAQLALMLDCQFFGLHAGAHHLVSLLVHLTNTLLLFWVLKQMTGAPWRSAFVAALFAWHPLHVETVASAVELEDLLSGSFWMLTFWAYVKHVTSGKCQVARMESAAAVRGGILLSPVSCHLSRYYWLALLFFALGLMCKPTIVTLPFVLLLLDYWPLKRISSIQFSGGSSSTPNSELRTPNFSRLLLEKLPFLGLATGSCVVTFYTEQKGGTVPNLAQNPFGLRFANAVTSYVAYLRKVVWPDDLAVFYPYPSSFPTVQVVTAVLLLVAITVGVVALHRTRPYLAVGWLWYLGTLVPTIGLVSVRAFSMADRYTYLPLIGVFVMLAWGVSEFVPREGYRRVALGFGAFAALAACIGGTTFQLRHWQSSLTLFRHAIAVTKDNYMAHEFLALARAEKGDLVSAREHLGEALRIKPGKDSAHFNLGVLCWLEGKPAEAITQYRMAIALRPTYIDALNNLARLLAATPDANLRNGDEAVRLAERAAVLTQTKDEETFDTLAVAYAEAGRFAEAVKAAQRALELAEATGNNELATQIRKRLSDFKSGRPYRQ